MGNRVHVVKRQREYGNSEAFNWKFNEFKSLLSNLGCDVCEQDDYSPEFEMKCDEYERGIKILKRIKTALEKDINADLNDIDLSDLADNEDEPNWCSFDPDDYDWNDIKDDIDNLEGYSIDEIINVMEIFWNERDKDSGWIQFSSF